MLDFIREMARNDVFNGVVGGSVVVSILYVVKWIPSSLWSTFMWRITTTLMVYSEDPAFERVDEWLSSLEYAKKARQLRLLSQASANGDGHDVSYSPGIGRHFIWHKGRPILVWRTEPDAKSGGSTQTWRRREDIAIKTFGLSTALMHDLVVDIVEAQTRTRKKMVDVYLYDDNWWRLACRKLKRSLESVVIPEEQRHRIVSDMVTFAGRSAWYNERGIPYRRGFLFEGPPGCGKTSLVMALASHFSKPIYVLNIGSLQGDSSLFKAITSVPESAILLIEDIDAAQATRSTKATPSPVGPVGLPAVPEENPVTLSGLLNAIDGTFSRDGRILVMTTNYPERIDAALLRPGRVDRREHIGVLKEREIRIMCRQFLGDRGDAVASGVAAPIAPADLQQILLETRGEAGPPECR